MIERREPYITKQSLLDLSHSRALMDVSPTHLVPPKQPAHMDMGLHNRPKGELDLLGDVLGMSQEEVRILHATAWSEIPNNEMMAKKYRELMMLAKFYAGDQLSKARAANAARDAAREKERRRYENDLRTHKKEVTRIHNLREQAKTTVESRWKKLVHSLEAIIAKDNRLASMDMGDQFIFHALHSRKLIRFVDGMVYNLKSDELLSASDFERFELLKAFQAILSKTERKKQKEKEKELLKAS